MIAEFKDIPKITVLARDFHAECFEGFPFDEAYFSLTISKAITEPSAEMFVHKVDGRVVAFLCGALGQYPAANCIQAQELFWFCHKDHRATGAIRLMKEYISWAKNNNAKVIYAGAVGDKANGVYKRMGFKQVETHWVLI